MKLHDILENTYQTFLDQMKRVRVLLLHPASRYRSVLVARLINTPDITTFYYAMGPDDINVQAFVSGITHDLATQHPTFGRHINALSSAIFEDFNKYMPLILETFAKDLAEISDDDFLLILDEYDRSDSADDVQRFVEKLPEIMPPNCKLVINSRTLPRLPWISLIAQNQAVLIQDQQIIRRSFYGQPNAENSQIEVYALGPDFVLLDHKIVDNWEGHLPRLLFFFVLDRPMVTRSDICRAFWPSLSAEQAVNVFHVTKRRLHKAIGMDMLIHKQGYYRLNPDLAIYCDVLDFVEALMRGRDVTNDSRIQAWQRVIDLYRGPYLQGHNDIWIEERRRHYRAGYIEAMQNMASHWEALQRPEQSLALMQKALTEDSLNESLHREVMRLYALLGRRSEAAAHYQDLLQNLMQLERAPHDDTHALYQDIMS